MPRRRTLIEPPLYWTDTPTPVAPPVLPVVAERGGTQLRAPKATLLVDTREQLPYKFSRFRGWFSGVKKKALKVGDYSIEGMEDEVTVERKDLPDLLQSFTTCRGVFVARLRKMADYPHRLLVVTASLSEVKSSYGGVSIDPNRITQSLIATLAGTGVPFICTETHELGAEITASYLYQIHLYHWLEQQGEGRRLVDGDL
jgi:ERCC4-type nuclease